MRYDLKKDLPKEAVVKLTWHGAPTRVLLKHEGHKVDVDTGETIAVTVSQAKELLCYSRNWTLKGDKPLEQPEPQKEEMKEPEDDKKEDDNKKPAVDLDALTPEVVAKMKKDDVIVALRAMEASFNDKALVEELRSLLVEKLEERKAAAAANVQQ